MATTKAASKKAAKKSAAKKAATVVATQVAQAIAAAAPVDDEETTTFVVLRPIHHSDGLYTPAAPGEDPTLIDLTEGDAAGLLKVKAIAPYDDEAAQ